MAALIFFIACNANQSKHSTSTIDTTPQITDDSQDTDLTNDSEDSSLLGDVDQDGFTVEAGDCDDANASVYPGAQEICGNEIDEDCDQHGCSPWEGGLLSNADAGINIYTQNPPFYGGLEMAVGDLSGDGVPDIIIGGSNRVIIMPYLPLQIATYEQRISQVSSAWTSIGAPLYGLGMEDINHDSVMDIIVGEPEWGDNNTLGAISIIVGPITEDRQSQREEAIFIGADNDYTGFAIQTAHFTNDMDIQIASGGYRGTIYLIDPVAPATPLATLSSVVGVIYHGGMDVGDVNGDGLADIFVTDAINQAETSVFLAPYPETQTQSDMDFVLPMPEGAEAVTHGDMDGDGLTDVIGAGHDGRVYLFESLSSGSSEVTAIVDVSAHGDPGLGMDTGDVNADGRLDLLVSLRNRDTLLLAGPIEGVVDTSFTGVWFNDNTSDNEYSYDSTLADLDGDGFEDLLIGWIGLSYAPSWAIFTGSAGL